MVKFANLTASVFRFSQPHDALIRPKSAGFISHRIRSWDLPSELCSSHAAVHCFQCVSSLLTFLRLQGLTPRQSPLLLLAV